MSSNKVLHKRRSTSTLCVAAWRYGSIVGRVNEVAVRRARLVLGWATVFGEHTTLVSLPSHLSQLSLLPSVGRENEYQPRAMTFCGWGGNGRLRKWCDLPSITCLLYTSDAADE